ncbi:hypothetical protein H9660_05620 [Clostridium sp. Sa3CUN1]|uniref:Transmembrane protein n=1 Tax=Clostridium gallinarum TaxID=2762246 RepID=A0ABR8Q2H3_9CLOT|nr:hypothetical protein [Clostridium gallinarum]MBD7914618.1 hypothetical protein [Clostridium gallinarum]
MVDKKLLLFLAGFVWSIAGYNVLHIGCQSYIGNISLKLITLSIIIFLFFKYLIFNKMVKKHTKRIIEYKNSKQWFWKFFDIKSFIIMAFMMSFGIIVRVNNLASESFIAFFYTGLGFALLLSGFKFFYIYIKVNFINNL